MLGWLGTFLRAVLCFGTAPNFLLEAVESLPIETHGGISLVQRNAMITRDHVDTLTAHNASARSSLHEVVGKDGVLMIHLERAAERANYTTARLAEAGIFPNKIRAADSLLETEESLAKACPFNNGPDPMAFCKQPERRDKHSKDYRPGGGCRTKTEQAITASHRRALLVAQNRQEEWTAILEDDAVPVNPEDWNNSFHEAWKNVPESTKIVRLGWCTFREPQGPHNRKPPIYKNIHGPKNDNFELIDWMTWGDWGYRVGGCTTAYMVHKSVIPELLGIFPCCCPIDCCLEYGLYNRDVEEQHGKTRGMSIMLSMDAKGSTDLSAKMSSLEQSGVLVQDNGNISSLRE